MKADLLLISLSILLFTHGSQGGRLRPDAFCVDGCSTAVGSIQFEQTIELDYYKATCATPVFVDSLIYCAAIYCSPHEISAGLKAYNGTCKAYSPYYIDPYETLLAQIKSMILPSVPRVEEASTERYKQPVVPDEKFFNIALRTATAYDANINDSWTYGYACIGYWALVLLVGLINRTLAITKRWAFLRFEGRSAVHQPLALPPSIGNWLRRKLVLPGTFGNHVQVAIGGCFTIPPRLETLLLLLYITMNFVLCFPAYELFTGNIYWPQSSLQLSRYIADRAGILAFANLPMIWLFSARNDPFLWLTGWSFALFTRFHRWVARLVVMQAISHGVAYTVFSKIEGDLISSWKEQYWYMGAMALISMSVMLGFSIYWLRTYHYELFLIIHIVLAMVILIGLWFHVKIFNGQYNGFLWTCIAIWVFDRAVRIARIVYVNVIPRLSRKIDVFASYDADTELIRLDVTDYFDHEQVKPGIFYYLYEPNSWRGLESHPFTLCSWAPDTVHGMALSTEKEIGHVTTDNKSALRTTIMTVSAEGSGNREIRHTFLVRPYGGFTHRLQQKLNAASCESRSVHLSLLLEGPYGLSVNLKEFSDILVVAGGLGITAAVSHVNALLRDRGQCRNIHICWAVRQIGLVDDILRHELKVIHNQDCITMDVYHTPDREDIRKHQYPSDVVFTVQSGRPDIRAILEQDRRKSTGSLAMVCCGPATMADHCRSIVVQELRNGGPDVEFFNDAMSW